MKPTPISFNGTSLQSSDYQAYWVDQQPLQGNVSAIYTQRSGAWPYLSGKTFAESSVVIGIICKHDFTTLFESLNALFDVQDETPHQLIVRNDADSSSDNEYFINAFAVSPITYDGNEYLVTLALETPIWQTVTEFSQTFSTTSSTASTDFTIGGNCETYPTFEITPGSASTSEYAYSNYALVLPTSSRPWTNRPLRLSLDTQTLIGAAKMQADGDDLRVLRNEVEIDRWFDSTGLNTTDTGIWINATMPPARTFTLETAINSTSPTPSITAYSSVPAYITALPSSGRVIVDDEEFIYNSKAILKSSAQLVRLSTTLRAARNSTAAAHSVGATVKQVPIDFKFVYGNPTATAPATDDTRKPIIDLDSTNASFKYSIFRDGAHLRSAIFAPYIQVAFGRLTRSGVYTGANDTIADPATFMGVIAATYQNSGVWMRDQVTNYWRASFPDGIASVGAISGEKYQNSASWTPFTIQSSVSSTAWTTLYTLPALASTDYSTWVTWTAASTDMATIPANSRMLRFLHNGYIGTIGATTDEASAVGIDALTVGLSNPPTVSTRGEQSDYYIDFQLENDAGEYFTLQGAIISGSTITIDTDPEYPTVTYAGALVNGMLTPSTTRARWLALQPGHPNLFYQTNLSTATDIVIVVKWRNRMNFL